MSVYAPRLIYLCDDEECCDNGAPSVTCKHCGQRWPCSDYRASHTEAQIRRQKRWVLNKIHMGDRGMVEWSLRTDDGGWPFGPA